MLASIKLPQSYHTLRATMALGMGATTAKEEDRACRFIAETGGEQGRAWPVPERPSSDCLVRARAQNGRDPSLTTQSRAEIGAHRKSAVQHRWSTAGRAADRG